MLDLIQRMDTVSNLGGPVKNMVALVIHWGVKVQRNNDWEAQVLIGRHK